MGKIYNPSVSKMKFAPYIIVLVLFCCAKAAPQYGNGKYTDSKFLEGKLDKIQGAVIDMMLAGEDLEVGEKVLEKLVSQKQVVFDAESLLQKATDASPYNDVWQKDQ